MHCLEKDEEVGTSPCLILDVGYRGSIRKEKTLDSPQLTNCWGRLQSGMTERGTWEMTQRRTGPLLVILDILNRGSIRKRKARTRSPVNNVEKDAPSVTPDILYRGSIRKEKQ